MTMNRWRETERACQALIRFSEPELSLTTLPWEGANYCRCVRVLIAFRCLRGIIQAVIELTVDAKFDIYLVLVALVATVLYRGIPCRGYRTALLCPPRASCCEIASYPFESLSQLGSISPLFKSIVGGHKIFMQQNPTRLKAIDCCQAWVRKDR